MSIEPRRGLPDDGADPITQTELPARVAESETRLSSLLTKLPRLDTQVGNRVVRATVPIVAALALTGTVAGATALRNGNSAATTGARPIPQPAGFDPGTRSAMQPELSPSPSTKPSDPPKSDAQPKKAPPPAQLRNETSSSSKSTKQATKSSPRTSGLPATAVGTRYVNASINVRSAASAESAMAGSLDAGDRVQITANTEGAWQQIVYRGSPRWVKSEYLSKQRPKSTTKSRSDSPGSGSRADSGSGSSKGTGGSCGRSLGSKAGLSASASRTWDAVCANFPNVKSIGGTRGGDGGSYHGEGRAIDVMVGGDQGWEIARWARANASSLGVTEVIYAQKIWTTQRSGEGWRSMSNRGGSTANHYDHVHLSTK